MNTSRTVLAAGLALSVVGLSAYYLTSCSDQRSGSSAPANASSPTTSPEPKADAPVASHGAPAAAVNLASATSPAVTSPAETSPAPTPPPPPAGVVITDLKNLPKSDVDPVKDLSERYTKHDLDLIARLTARSLPVDEKITSLIAARNQGASPADLEAKISAAYPGLSNLPVRDELVRWAHTPADAGATAGSIPTANPPAPSQPLMNKPVERTKKPEEYK